MLPLGRSLILFDPILPAAYIVARFHFFNSLYRMISSNSLEYLIKKDRIVIISGLFFITILSWLYIIYLYNQMVYMDMNALFFAMPMTPEWTVTDFILLFLMWLVMMIAMMTPSVAPLILIFATVNRQRRQQDHPFVNTLYLMTGYFLIWAAFSLAATSLQWLLQQISMLNPEMKTTSKILGSTILILAGIFQFTPLKQTCLKHCRSPLGFVLLHWKEGKQGALRMGIENGFYCVGCCWMLMVLLFVAGIMNLLWVALIALFVLVEKISPGIKWIPYVAGLVLIVYGVLLLAR
jgi:predicted metal-binding membrane protein